MCEEASDPDIPTYAVISHSRSLSFKFILWYPQVLSTVLGTLWAFVI